MNADQIREAHFESDDGAWECARWLQEIAAQLAERNAQLESVTTALIQVMDAAGQAGAGERS